MSNWTAETAEWYAAKYGDYPTNRLAVDYLDLPEESSIVDIGCGTGSALRQAAIQVTAGKLIGIDPVQRMIEIAREKTLDHPANDRISFKVGPAEEIPVETDFADFVFAFDSLDHWQDPVLGLREIQRILKPAGRLVLVKDQSVPGAKQAQKTLLKLLNKINFEIFDQQEIAGEEISFSLWVCGGRKPD